VVRAGLGALRYRLAGHRMPLAVTLVLTHRCDAMCRTCAHPLQYRAELDTRTWVGIIDELAGLGAARVGFSGGEPLVREDLPVLVDRCADHGLWTTVETNGYRYPELAPALGRLSRVMFGLEGRESVHDSLREPGAWRRVMAALEVAASRDQERALVTTLTSANLDQVEWIVDTAAQSGAEAVFEVLQVGLPSTPRSARALVPDPNALRRTLRWLVEARAAGRPIAMSEKLLRYLIAWPDYAETTSVAPREDVHCVAGQLHCAIEPDGMVLPCVRLSGRFEGGNARDGGFASAFERLRDNACRACTSTPLTEYNFLFNLNPPALYERARGYLAARERR
jgi:MoaA/NifB/PqqE/SkfB family radical SAM enzyme